MEPQKKSEEFPEEEHDYLHVDGKGKTWKFLFEIKDLGWRGWLLLLTVLSGLSTVILTLAQRIKELLQ